MITPEQADQAKEIILETLDTHHKGNLPYRDIWTKPVEDFEGLAYVYVWIIYDGKPDILDTRMNLSYGSYLYQTLIDAGIRALPSISYLPQSDVDEVGKECLMAGW